MPLSSVASGTFTGNVRTITATTNATPVVVTTSAAHGFLNGDVVKIDGCDVGTLNAEWTIQNVAGTTFELVGSTAPGSAGTTGTVGNFLAILPTAVGVFVLKVDLRAMASGDKFDVVDKHTLLVGGVEGTRKRDAFSGVQAADAKIHQRDAVAHFNATRFLIGQYAGTNRAFDYRLLRVT